jgi:hypothetical protein
VYETSEAPLTAGQGDKKGGPAAVRTGDGKPACPFGSSLKKGECVRSERMPAQKVGGRVYDFFVYIQASVIVFIASRLARLPVNSDWC